MQNFIRLQTILSDPKKDFLQFKTELQNSQITQTTYMCLFLNMAASIKRQTFDFPAYMNLLLNFGKQEGRWPANINYTGYKDKISILMNACEKSSSNTVRCLVNHPQIKLHIKDPNQMNALFYAIKNSDQSEGLKIMEIFLQVSNQMIDHSIKNNYSLLFFAVDKFKLKIVQFLLKNGVDPNQKLISSGNTPLHQFIKISTKYNLQEVSKLFQIFFRYGFDIQVKNNDGQTIIEYAQQMCFNITELITEIQQKKYNSEIYPWSEDSQNEEMSSKKGATTKLGDTITNDNCSQFLSREMSDICIRSDFQSRSVKSQLSQNHHFHFDNKEMMEKEFSADMSQNCSPYYQIEQQNKFIQFYTNQEFQECIDKKSSSSKKSQKYVRSQPSYSDAEESDQQDEAKSEQSDEFLKAQQIDYEKIHNQLIEFNQISKQIYMSAWRQIEPFLNKLSQLGEQYGLKLELVGSFATGLWTYLSDIDIALVAMSDFYMDFQKILQKVYNRLKTNMYKFGIKQISINKYSKVQSIKLQMDQYLYGSRKIDIYVFHRKNTGKVYVNYISQALRFYPQISCIFFTIKRVCQQFKLHDPLQGGLKAYTLFLMIYSIMQTLQTKNMGKILYQICLYYGFYFQYDYDLDNINKKDFPQWNLKVKLNIGDPLNTKNNMGGKNTDGTKVQKMFRTIYYALHKKLNEGTALQFILQLAQVL